MIITSKFSGTCKACNGYVRMGERVNWVRGIKGVTHVVCNGTGEPISEPTPIVAGTGDIVGAALAIVNADEESLRKIMILIANELNRRSNGASLPLAIAPDELPCSKTD